MGDALIAALGVCIEDFFCAAEGMSILNNVLSLISDIERRCMLHVAALRRHPKIFTPCCGIALCWKCKIAGHHPGMTCEEIQQAELQVEAQFCPNCGVATQKTEGCQQIACLCGAIWQWDGDDLGIGALEDIEDL